jgi:HSP20 family protein
MSTYLPAVISTIGSEAFNRQIDRMFEDAWRAIGTADRSWMPACNAWEDDNGFYVQMAVPGWEPKDITLEVDNQVLTVRGQREQEVASQRTFHMQEIPEGRFIRTFRLPTYVDQHRASAVHKNGLLTVTLPKREEAKLRRITIEG